MKFAERCTQALITFSLPGAIALAFAGCTGSFIPSEQPPSDMNPSDPLDVGPMLPAPGSDEWRRNPQKEMRCDQQPTTNPMAYPLQRLTNLEIERTVRDLLAGIGNHDRLVRRNDLPSESRVAGFSNNAYQQLADRNYSEAIEVMAMGAAAEAVKDLNRLGCANQDGSCVESFVRGFGKRVFRRPLTDDEVMAFRNLYNEAKGEPFLFSHTMAMETVVGAMLQSPQFLYRIEEGAGEVNSNQGRALTGWEMASRLSYLLWDTMPDDALFAAAERGDLSQASKLEEQVRRLLDDPRARVAVKEFHTEWLEIARYDAFLPVAAKDPQFFPNYTDAQSEALRAGRDRFIEESFFGGNRSMTQLFASNKGWVNDASAEIYGVDPPGSRDLVEVDLPSQRRKGILTNPGIMAGMSHTTEGAPILRGGFIMDRILCAPSPPPPDDVVREVPFVENEPITYRRRVEITTQEGAMACRGCHMPLNAFGFLFENYNPIGAYQTEEQVRFRGQIVRLPTNARATIGGTLDADGEYENAIPFVEKLSRSPQVAQCLVENWWIWANARKEVEEDGCAIVPITTAFMANGFDMQRLIVELVKHPAFRTRSAVAP